jgi:hypothetical protein
MDAISFLQSVTFTLDADVLSLVRNHSLSNDPPLLGVSRTRRKDRGPRQVLEWDIKEAEIIGSAPFYVPLRCEWRGRMLPISDLHYARDDYLRAMFRFAQGAKIGERGIYWLKVSTANCFGGLAVRDKDGRPKAFNERVNWVHEKWDTIHRLVADPPSGLRFGLPTHVFKIGSKTIAGTDAEPFWKQASGSVSVLFPCKRVGGLRQQSQFHHDAPAPARREQQRCAIL